MDEHLQGETAGERAAGSDGAGLALEALTVGGSLGGSIGQGGGDVWALPPPEQAISPVLRVTEF
eukprot:318243-Karenia_brevis.AAC.1